MRWPPSRTPCQRSDGRRGRAAPPRPPRAGERPAEFVETIIHLFRFAAQEPDNGFLGFLAGPLEAALNGIEKVLEGLNVPYAYGFSIIVLTLAVKLVTWPLSQVSFCWGGGACSGWGGWLRWLGYGGEEGGVVDAEHRQW